MNDESTDTVPLIDAEKAFISINREAFMHIVKIIFPITAAFVSNS